MHDSRYQVLHADPFYQSAPWIKLRQAYRQASPLCEACKAEGKVAVAEHIHHIVPREIDRAKQLEWDNLQALCHSCHSKLHSNKNYFLKQGE